MQPPHYEDYLHLVDMVKTARWNPTADPESPYTIEILTYVDPEVSLPCCEHVHVYVGM